MHRRRELGLARDVADLRRNRRAASVAGGAHLLPQLQRADHGLGHEEAHLQVAGRQQAHHRVAGGHPLAFRIAGCRAPAPWPGPTPRAAAGASRSAPAPRAPPRRRPAPRQFPCRGRSPCARAGSAPPFPPRARYRDRSWRAPCPCRASDRKPLAKSASCCFSWRSESSRAAAACASCAVTASISGFRLPGGDIGEPAPRHCASAPRLRAAPPSRSPARARTAARPRPPPGRD